MDNIVTCPDCGKTISVDADPCPNCGCILAGKRSKEYPAWIDAKMREFRALAEKSEEERRQVLKQWISGLGQDKFVRDRCENHFWRRLLGLSSPFVIIGGERVGASEMIALRCVDCGLEKKKDRAAVEGMIRQRRQGPV